MKKNKVKKLVDIQSQNILSALPRITAKKKKRLGRGYGSGKGGHTTNRGQKGQKSRSKPYLLFSGRKTKKSLLRRIPLWRGKGKLKSSLNPVIITLSDLNKLRSGSVVDEKNLIKVGLINKTEMRRRGVKILSNGQLKKGLKIKVAISQTAKKAVEEAGGEIINNV